MTEMKHGNFGRKLISVAQVAKRLSVSESTVLRHIYSGELAAIRAGVRMWRIDTEDLSNFLATRINAHEDED